MIFCHSIYPIPFIFNVLNVFTFIFYKNYNKIFKNNQEIFCGLDEIIKKEEFLYYVWKEKFLNKTLKSLLLFYTTEDNELC